MTLRVPSALLIRCRAKASTLALLLFLVFLIAAAVNAATLHGIVLDEGASLSGVTVALYSTDQVRQTISDREGRFVFENVVPGSYEIGAERIGFIMPTSRTLQISSEQPSAFIAIDANSALGYCGNKNSYVRYEVADSTGANILGRVWGISNVGSHRKSLGGVKLAIYNKAGRREALARSSADGHFAFQIATFGKYTLKAVRRSYRTEVLPLWVTRTDIARVQVEMHNKNYLPVCQ